MPSRQRSTPIQIIEINRISSDRRQIARNNPALGIMAQRMRRHALGDSRRPRRGGNRSTELPGRHRVDRIEAGKQPAPRLRDLPPVAQQLQQLRREHHEAILLPLALLDAQQHALAVDIGDLQRDDLGYAQARAIGDAERRLVFDAGGGGEKSSHLLRLKTIGTLRGSLTNVRRRTRSSRSSVTLKKNRSATTVALMTPGLTWVFVMCN